MLVLVWELVESIAHIEDIIEFVVLHHDGGLNGLRRIYYGPDQSSDHSVFAGAFESCNEVPCVS